MPPSLTRARGRRVSSIVTGAVLGGLVLAGSAGAQEPAPDAWALARKGRERLRQRAFSESAALLQRALAQAPGEGITGDDLGVLYYLHALALARADRDAEALASLRRAVVLSPQDALTHLELAQIHLRGDHPEDARRAAERALALGLPDAADQADARSVVDKARRQILHDRFVLDASVSIGFDSNVLQGASRETIAGRNTGASTRATRPRTRLQERREQLGLIDSLFSNYQETIRDALYPATGSLAEADLPISLLLDAGGRVVGTRRFELWLGARFSQVFMTSPGRTPALGEGGTPLLTADGSAVYDADHDAYSTQEHTLYARAQWTPVPWLLLRPRIEGFANFTGLRSFTPFQGGFLAALDTLFLESTRFRTRLVYQHQLRRSFDRDDDSYLDADRDEVRLTQEVRLRGARARLRGQLGYRFRSEQTGVLSAGDLPYRTTLVYQVKNIGGSGNGLRVPLASDLGTYVYRAPLSYLANEISTRWRVTLPHRIELGAGLAYEYRAYAGTYQTRYVGAEIRDGAAFIPPGVGFDPARMTAALCTPAEITARDTTACTGVLPASRFAVASEKRRDHLIFVDLSIAKELPRGFNLELTYAFLRNFSSIATQIDNRSYTKHTVTLTALYSF